MTARISEFPNIQGIVNLNETQSFQYSAVLFLTPRNDLVITVTIDDANKPPASLVNRPISDILVVDYNFARGGYELRMKVGLDRDGSSPFPDDDINFLQFRLECNDPAVPNTINYHALKIQIVDINDNPPTVLNTPYLISISELTPVNMTVFSKIASTDLDNQNNKIVGYTISSALSSQFNGNGVFAIPETTSGVVILSQPQDFEAMLKITGSPLSTIYQMNVTAKDFGDQNPAPGNVSLYSWTLFNITIVDGDDLGPVFIYPSCPISTFKSCVWPKYTSSIVSGTIQGPSEYLVFHPVPLLTDPNQTVEILFRDGDTLNSAVNCSISYTIPTGFAGNFAAFSQRVSLNSNQYRCLVRVTTPINRANAQSIDIILLATEETPNTYSDEAVITLTVSPRNQFDPQLVSSSGQFVGYILENSDVGTTVKNDSAGTGVLKLSVTDLDINPSDPKPDYRITLTPATTFEFDSLGFIYLRQGPLDYETQTVYTFTIIVQELDTAEQRSSTQTLIITVVADMTAPSTPRPTGNDDEVSAALVVGWVLACLFFLTLVLVIVYFVHKHRRALSLQKKNADLRESSNRVYINEVRHVDEQGGEPIPSDRASRAAENATVSTQNKYNPAFVPDSEDTRSDYQDIGVDPAVNPMYVNDPSASTSGNGTRDLYSLGQTSDGRQPQHEVNPYDNADEVDVGQRSEYEGMQREGGQSLRQPLYERNHYDRLDQGDVEQRSSYERLTHGTQTTI